MKFVSNFSKVLMFLFLGTVSSMSADLYVSPGGGGDCSQANPCSFQQALTTAQNNGEDDTIHVMSGTYNVSSTLTYSTDNGDGGHKLTIQAQDPNNKPVLDGGGNVQIMNIKTDNDNNGGDGGADVRIENITFRNGNSTGNGGGLYVKTTDANITVENCRFESNTSNYGGGACVESDSGNATVQSSEFTNNTASNNGGGACVESHSGDTTVQNSQFTNNTASNNGGGAYVESDSGNATVQDSQFTNNTADYGGGTYVWSNSGNATVQSSEFENNTASNGGGARVYSISGDATVLQNSKFENNRADEDGGGAYVESDSGNAIVQNSQFTNNTSNDDGGGAYVESYSGGAIVQDSQFTNNTAGGDGGGAYVYSDSGDAIVQNSQFTNNTAGGDGGGVYVCSDSGNAIVQNSQFIGNTADERGGGAYVYSEFGGATVENSVFANNTSGDKGGGLFIDPDETVASIINNSFYSNRATNADSQGGGIYVLLDLGDDLNLYNNIFWSSEASTGRDVYVDVEDSNFQNIYNNDFSCNDFSGEDQTSCLYVTSTENYNHADNISQDPRFVNPDAGNLHITENSPCIDAGNNTAPGLPDKDMDGENRIINGIVDIGADEYSGASPANNPPVINTFTAIPTTGAAPLNVNFNWNVTDPDNDPLTCTLNYGDGSPAWTGDCNNAPQTHTYNTPGIYRATVTAEDYYRNQTQSDPVEITVGDQKQQQTQNGTITLKTNHSTIDRITNQEPECNIPQGQQAPYGQISYRIHLPEGTNTETITITLPENAQGITIYKCKDGQLQDITGMTQINTNTITLTLTDNGQLDENPEEGIIEDPIIIAKQTEQTTGGGGEGGCSIAPLSTTTGIFNLLIMLSGIAGLGIRRKRQ